LTSDWSLEGSRLLDVGCGFGDFVSYLDKLKLENYEYTGIDLVDEFISEGLARNNSKDVSFVIGDFLELEIGKSFDYAIASGTFNLSSEGLDGYDFIERSMRKMLEVSEKAISIDFLSDRVDYRHPHNFNSNPARILELAFDLSKNVCLKNNYFPFEFAITIYKDDSFSPETTTFREAQKKLEI
jgi:SAM-dependent methyltransferase